MLKHSLVAVSLICALTATVVGCAKQEFERKQYVEKAAAVGSRFLPAKVDILLVVDNTPSAAASVAQMQTQLGSFLSDMQGKFWDYHVARMPLSNAGSYATISKVLVNPQFNSTTLSDGTSVPATGIVPSSFATTDPTNFMAVNTTTTDPQGDTVFQPVYNTLVHANDQGTNFLRNDAMLAVVFVTNGYEKTVWTYDQYGTSGYLSTGDSAQRTFAQNLINLKGSRQFVQFFAVASYADVKNFSCQGSNAYPGTSYLDLIVKGYLNGSALNFCDSGSLSSVLGTLDSNLQVIRQDYVYSAIVLDAEPVPESIVITRSNGQVIPQDSVNGWQYVGLGSAYTISGIYDPSSGSIIPLNPGLSQRSGYVIQLNGSGKLIGDDAPGIQYERR